MVGIKPPIARCEYPAVAMIGEVIFDASSSYDPDGKIVSYQWELRIDVKLWIPSVRRKSYI
jgi:hypothetical protein